MWVLQIDDDEDDLEIFSNAVKVFNPAIEYHGKSSMEAAMLLFDKGDSRIPDVVFLDINMPRHSGFDCFGIFQKDQRFTKTRFIFLSTSVNPKLMPEGTSFMKKQHSLTNYVAMLRDHLLPLLPNGSSETRYQYFSCASLYETLGIRG